MSKKITSLPTIEQVEAERENLKHKKQYLRAVRSTLSILLVVAAAAVLVATLFLPILQVSGSSMEPTLVDGDIIVMEKSDSFETGEMVGFYYQSKILLKRVIGQPGDYIEVDENGTVYVNGVPLDEPYISEKSLGTCDIEFPYQVPDGRWFVLGDHRSTSIDSRSSAIGCIKSDQIIGRVVMRIWPLSDIGIFQ